MTNPFYTGQPQALQALGGVFNTIAQQNAEEEAQQQQQAQQTQMQQELTEAFKSGDPNAIAEMSFKYPQMAKLMDNQLKFKSEATKQNALDSLRRVNSGEDPEKVFHERISKVVDEGGDPSHTIAELEAYRKDPDGWLKQSERAFAMMDPEGFKSLQSIGPQVKDELKATELNIKQEANEIRKLEVKERALDRQLARETNELKREKLAADIEATKREREQKSENFKIEGEQVISDMDSQLDSVDALLNSPGLESAVGFSSILPTLPGGEAANFEGKLEQLQSQQFLNNVKKMVGMGSLSEAEGKKIAAAAGALSLNMSERQFKKELNIIKDNLEKAKQHMARRYGIEAPKKATESTLSIDELVNKYGN